MTDIIAFLRALKLDLSNEKRAQGQIATAFDDARVAYEREVVLSERERIDFLVGRAGEAGIGVEVKLKNNRRAEVSRQLARYAKSPRVEALVLVTNLSMGLPPAIDGKPTYYVSMGRAWMA